MKLPLVPLALLAFLAGGCATVSSSASAPSAPTEGGKQTSLSLLLGARSMSDSDHWTPNDDQTAGEIGFAMPISDWPVGLEATISHSSDSSSGVDGDTSEASVGVRKTWDVGDGAWHPYVGGGLAMIKAKVEGGGQSDDDTSGAGYLHGGAYYDLSTNWHLGVDLRFLFGSDITLFGTNGDADYAQFGIFVAYAF